MPALKKLRPEDALDALEIVNLFKLDPKTLGYVDHSPPSHCVSCANGACRKNAYQILYFLMNEPLSEHERLARKEEFSMKMM